MQVCSAPTRAVKLSSGLEVKAKAVVLATGLEPKPPTDLEFTKHRFPNAQFYTYKNAPLSCDEYFQKHVLIFGNGNAGTELSSWIIAECAATRTWMVGNKVLNPSHMSHYVGNVRTNNMLAMESYQLKSLDAVVEEPSVERVLNSGVLYDSIEEQVLTVKDTLLVGDSSDIVVIHATGFTASLNITNVNSDPWNLYKSRYPQLSAFNELADMSDVFAAGAISHGRDYKESSGGFIHGFRYTSATTMKLLNGRMNKRAWPYLILDADAMKEHLVNRIQTSSALWHLQAFLADLVIPVRGVSGEPMFLYVEEIPVAWEFDIISRHVVRDYYRRIPEGAPSSSSSISDNGLFVTSLGHAIIDYLLDLDEAFSGPHFYEGNCALKESLLVRDHERDLRGSKLDPSSAQNDPYFFEKMRSTKKLTKVPTHSCLEKWLSEAVIKIDGEAVPLDDEVEAMKIHLFEGQQVSINDRQNMESFDTTIKGNPFYGPGRLALLFNYGKEFKGCDAVYSPQRPGQGFISPTLYLEKDPRVTPFSGEKGMEGSEFLKFWRGWDNISENEDLYARWKKPRIVMYFLEIFFKAAGMELEEPGSSYVNFLDDQGFRDFWYLAYEEAGEATTKDFAYRHSYGRY